MSGFYWKQSVITDKTGLKVQINTIKKPAVLNWVLQLSLFATATSAGLFVFGIEYAKAGIFATMLWSIPQAYYCFLAFRYRGARLALKATKATQQGMIGKLVLSAVILVAIFQRGGDFSLVTMFVMYFVLYMVGTIGFVFKINHPR
jgi:F0F1-type ATP synthase assembly protein I